MAHPQRTTNVIVESSLKHGVFANAFRIVDETGPDCFLDYMVYSEDANEAKVVARVRVNRDFLPNIRETLCEAMVEFDSEDGQITPQSAVPRKNGETIH
jgi:hypothetical protein